MTDIIGDVWYEVQYNRKMSDWESDDWEVYSRISTLAAGLRLLKQISKACKEDYEWRLVRVAVIKELLR